MNNVRFSINLLKLKKSGVATIHGVRCVVIPIGDNDIYISNDETNKPKGAYLAFCAWASSNSKYGNTHLVKQSFSKEFRNKHPDSERLSPILGNGMLLQTKQDSRSSKIGENPKSDPFTGDSDNIPF